MNQIKKTSSQLYRDCLRLSYHIAGNVRNLITYFIFFFLLFIFYILTLLTSFHFFLLLFTSFQSPKGLQIKKLIKNEFLKNKNELDSNKVEILKGNAIRALTNYLMIETSLKDSKINQNINKLKSKDIEDLNKKNQQ